MPSASNWSGYNPLQFFIFDAMTGNLVDILPFSSVTFSRALNSTGTFRGTLNILDPKIHQHHPWITSTAPNHNIIAVSYKQQVWLYLINSRKPSDTEPGVFEIDGTSLTGYFSQRVQATDYSSPPYSGINSVSGMPWWNAANLSTSGTPYAWDPMLMAAQVIIDMLQVPYGNLLSDGLYVQCNGYHVFNDHGAAYLASGTNTPSSNYLSESYPFTQLMTIDTIVNQLAQLGYGTGFDIQDDAVWTSGVGSAPACAYSLSYPRRGWSTMVLAENYLTQGSNLIVTELGSGWPIGIQPGMSVTGSGYIAAGTTVTSVQVGGGDMYISTNALQNASTTTLTFGYPHVTIPYAPVRQYGFVEDGTQMANLVYETGGNQDISANENIYSIQAGYPLFEKVTNRAELNSANVSALLAEMGTSDLVLFSWPPVTPTCSVSLFDPQCGLGTADVGSDVMVSVPATDQTDQQVFDPRFPVGMLSEWRVTSWEATVSDQGDATLAYTLDTPPVQVRSASSLPGVP